MQVACAALWRAWGIVPDTLVGHGIDGLAAAHIGGALSMEDALRLLAFFQGQPRPDVSPRPSLLELRSSMTGDVLRGDELVGTYWDEARRNRLRPAGIPWSARSLFRAPRRYSSSSARPSSSLRCSLAKRLRASSLRPDSAPAIAG